MEAEPVERQRRMRGGLGALMTIGILLLATHHGEFWPYSTYPMFSRAGKRWQRTLVREDDGIAEADRWRASTLDALPGKAFPLRAYGVEAVELSGYLDNTSDWSPARREGLRAMFGDALRDHELLVYRVTPGAGVRDAVATPILRLDQHGVELAPTASVLAGQR